MPAVQGAPGAVRRNLDVGLAARFADDAILLYGDGRWRHGAAEEVLNAATLSELYGTALQELRWPEGRTFVPA